MPACTQRKKPGPNRDPHDKLTSTNNGLVPGIGSHACCESAPLRSRGGKAAEIEHLIDEDRLCTPKERTVCANPDCVYHARPVGRYAEAYCKDGFTANCDCRCHCISCGSSPSVSDPPRLPATNQK